ncbi:MAG: hypothetical protein HZB46_12840, partial [Solirubrobacterales bacterium]|nr:hypothetical protein [Solirubrobacterales bacterium]
MRRFSLLALLVGIVLAPFAVAFADASRRDRIADADRMLATEADEHGGDLAAYFERAR